MIISGKHIPRRALLKGLGVSVALPLLELGLGPPPVVVTLQTSFPSCKFGKTFT